MTYIKKKDKHFLHFKHLEVHTFIHLAERLPQTKHTKTVQEGPDRTIYYLNLERPLKKNQMLTCVLNQKRKPG